MKTRPEPARIRFTLCVNGLEFRELCLRPRRGSRNDFDVLINDSRIGPFALHEDFQLDVPTRAPGIWRRLSMPELKAAVLGEARRYAYDLDEPTRESEDTGDGSGQSNLEPIPRIPIEGDSSHIDRASEALRRSSIGFEIVGGLDSRGQSTGHLTLVVGSLLGARMCLRRVGFLETQESRCVLLDSITGWKVHLLKGRSWTRA